MRRVYVLATIGLLVSILAVPGVLADVYDNWEWDGYVRKITYSFDMLSDTDKKAVEDSDPYLKSLTTLSNTWKGWVNAAAAKWNTALAAERKKWELVKVSDNGMIRVVSGDWSDGTLGQLFNWGYTCVNGREMWERGVIVMNTPLSKWCTTDSGKFEPVRTVMHEFGHVFCLDHQNTTTSEIMIAYDCVSSTATTVACGARETPLRSTTLSAKDKQDAKDSAKNQRTCDKPETGGSFGPTSLPPSLGHRIVTGFLHFNMSQAPFNDIRVRQAICYGIDRTELMKVLNSGYPLFSPIPFPLLGVPSLSRVTDEGLLYDQDVQKARQLLADAGYPNGLSIEVVIPYNSDPHKQVMLIIQHQLRQCNIEVTIAEVPPVSFFAQTQAGGMPMLLILSPVLSGEEIFSQYHTFSVGLGMPQFEELNQLIVAGQNASTGLERSAIWEEAQIQLLREVPAYPLFVTLD